MYELEERKNRGRCFHCKCDCGNEKDVRGVSLKNGDTQSCGCLARELASSRNKNQNVHDLSNQRFGRLIALEPTEERDFGSVVWKCQCDCGAVANVSSKNLVCGNTQSCGCLRSKGELAIKELLEKNNIPFEQQYHFDDLKSEKGYHLYYDFFVDNKVLVEFDGEQHYKKTSFFSHENFEYRKQNDEKKTVYAEEHNIPLIRIKYEKLKTLTLEDVFPIEYQ